MSEKKLNAYPTVGLRVGINKFWRFGVIWHNVSFLRDFFLLDLFIFLHLWTAESTSHQMGP